MPYTVVEIKTIDQLNQLIWNQYEELNSKRFRSNSIYRGLPNENYHLATSLHRNCYNKSTILEQSLLRNFAKYAAIEDESISNSIWKQLVVGQHHGLPTRLLDWSYSPLVALHFATSGDALTTLGKENAVIWEIDIIEMNDRLPLEYKEKLRTTQAYLLTIDMLQEISTRNGYEALKEYDRFMNAKAMALIEPPSIDQRIISQYSYFSIIPAEMENAEDDYGIENFLNTTSRTKKYVIDKEIVWRIRDMLDQMNINERTVYPGLDGLSQWLKRHYYVKR